MCYNYYSDNMIETIKRILKFKGTINEVKPALISGFANFYGADDLEEIEEKINNVPIAIKIEEDFVNSIILEMKLNELNKYIIDNINDKELLNYINKVILRKSIKDNKMNIKVLEKLKYSDDLRDIKTYNEYNNLKDEFNRIQNKYQETNNIVNNHIKSLKLIKEKYNIEYQNRIKDILLNHTNIPVDKIIDNLELFTGVNFEDIPLVFLAHQKEDEKSMEQFENDMLFPKEMLLQEIQDLKKEYFYKITDKDLNLEDYYTNEETKKIILSEKILSNLQNVRKKIISNYNKVVIDILDLLTTKENLTKEFYNEYGNSKGSEMNFRPYKKDNTTEQEKFIIIYIHDMDSLNDIDGTLIHELNHLIELRLEEETDDKIIYTLGWNKYVYDFKTNEMIEINDNKYNYINDGINELISKDILNQLREKKKKLFIQENQVNSLNYEILLQEFYEEYKEEIIESRRQGNINIIIEKVGKDNFNDLNNLINDYSRFFQRSTPTNSFINKKNEIISNMKRYNEMRNKK